MSFRPRPSRPPLLALAVLLSALAAPPAAHAAPLDTAVPTGDGGKVSITADNFVVEDNQHQADFTGHVVVVQSQVTVHADHAVAHYGAKGATSISSFEATGNVQLVTKDQTATGDRAVFDPKSRLLTLTGNVVVVNKTGTVKSDKLIVDLKTGKSVFTSTGGRVTGVFSSDE